MTGESAKKYWTLPDAFKHHHPDRPNATVWVSTNIYPQDSGWGAMLFGEGKYGGVEEGISSPLHTAKPKR
jgi:hypothetical protein